MQQRTMPLDAETKVAERPHDHKDELRLWLRLFTCKEVIESEVRRRLRDSFDVTLPRFDLMAQLYRAPKAMTLGELSQRMMVSNGNVTGLVDRLLEQGLLSRRPSPITTPSSPTPPKPSVPVSTKKPTGPSPAPKTPRPPSALQELSRFKTILVGFRFQRLLISR